MHSAAVRVQGHQESPVTRDMPLFAIVPLGALGMVRGPHTLTMRGVRLRACARVRQRDAQRAL